MNQNNNKYQQNIIILKLKLETQTYITNYQLKQKMQCLQAEENAKRDLQSKIEELWKEELKILGSNMNANIKQMKKSIINNKNSWEKARNPIPYKYLKEEYLIFFYH